MIVCDCYIRHLWLGFETSICLFGVVLFAVRYYRSDKMLYNECMKIRLQEAQLQAIKGLAMHFFESDKVWLFGSRTNTELKGGDIDLYIQTKRKDRILESKLAFLREFQKRFGEQKVDLLVDNGMKQKEIYDIARKEGVLL